MVKKILLNGSKYKFGVDNLPCLIHGKAGSGASLFTVSLIANLYQQGLKQVFLSGYSQAQNELIEQIGGLKHFTKPDGFASAKSDLIFIQKENSDFLSHLTKSLPDFDNRVVLIKNIDLFNDKLFSTQKDHQRLIVSGDLDKCSFAKNILKINYQSKIVFSKSKHNIVANLPKLNQYQAFFKNTHKITGIVTVKV